MFHWSKCVHAVFAVSCLLDVFLETFVHELLMVVFGVRCTFLLLLPPLSVSHSLSLQLSLSLSHSLERHQFLSVSFFVCSFRNPCPWSSLAADYSSSLAGHYSILSSLNVSVLKAFEVSSCQFLCLFVSCTFQP